MESPELLAEKKPRKKTTEKQDDVELRPDQIIKSNKGVEYLVERLIGSGGFGQVWKVCLLKERDKKFAMKTEHNVAPHKDMLRLKCEVNLFDEIERTPNSINKSHFVRMHDKGKTSTFKYMIMDLIWLSLKEVKETICGDVFTPHTKIKVARQTLKGIESLHEIGFLHRDIKPHNFAVGLPPKESIIYILDFGIARPYRDKDGEVRKARKTVKFMGTLQYASMECLCRNEQSRRDDLEVWMYMMLEFYDRTNLSWHSLEPEDAQLHVEYRSELMQKSRELHADGRLKAPEKWCDIIEVLNQMNYEDPGDFTQINLFLSQICVDENIDENLPLDWVGKKPISPEKPKKEEKKKERKKDAAVKKKKTVENKEGEEKELKLRRRRKSDDESDESDPDDSARDDYEAFLRWRKRRRSKKKRKSNDRGSNDLSDKERPSRKLKKETSDKKGSKGSEQELNEAESKESAANLLNKDNPGVKNEADKNVGQVTPEKLDGSDKEAKKKRDKENKKGPKKSAQRKKRRTPQTNEVNEKDPLKKSESNESNNERRDDKLKKKGSKRRESKESGEEKEDAEQKKIGVRKRESKQSDKKKYVRKKSITKDEKLDEKSPARPATPDERKSTESTPVKSDDKKK